MKWGDEKRLGGDRNILSAFDSGPTDTGRRTKKGNPKSFNYRRSDIFTLKLNYGEPYSFSISRSFMVYKTFWARSEVKRDPTKTVPQKFSVDGLNCDYEQWWTLHQ